MPPVQVQTECLVEFYKVMQHFHFSSLAVHLGSESSPWYNNFAGMLQETNQ